MGDDGEDRSAAESRRTGSGEGDERARRHLEVRGRVQGVGFRPYVYNLARSMKLGGTVANDPQGARIEVEGRGAEVDDFVRRLVAELPPLARIAELDIAEVAPTGETSFEIGASVSEGERQAHITPEAATCEDCLAELFDPTDRRFGYPFINCTNCGPRYSIVKTIPYDRVNTTMARFVMCPDCQQEYDDPGHRRFHAQPNACPVCGPRVWLVDRKNEPLDGKPIAETARRLKAGEIVAIRGLGGFHLACRADRDEVVARLRERKSREAKPFAMMVASLEMAAELGEIDPASGQVLTSPARPIVLVSKRAGAEVSEQVAPGTDTFGIMLPYTPLHWLLFAEGVGPLVMTSGNPSSEPLCADNAEALNRLGHIADSFLLHDRDIERRVDDSVVIAMERGRTGMQSIRRARGYVPEPIALRDPVPRPILAVGGGLKSTICLASGKDAVLSEHLGDLFNPPAYRNFVETVGQFRKLLSIEPEVVACDMHPDYLSTRFARGLGLPVIAVQHHHAHVASVMADQGLAGRVVGVICDGTGYGTDGAIWGCEILIADEGSFERFGQLRYFPLLGGDAAAHETWRPAVGLCRDALGGEWEQEAGRLFKRVDREARRLAARRLEAGQGAIATSSLGRLFDAVAFLLGACDVNRFEAEAPMRLEMVARACPEAEPLPYNVYTKDCGEGGSGVVLDFRPMIRRLVADVNRGRAAAELARAFHESVSAMLAEAARRAAEEARLSRVVVSGGCFVNRLLTDGVVRRLDGSGLDVYLHESVPAGDGGVSLGQAVVAAESIRRGA